MGGAPLDVHAVIVTTNEGVREVAARLEAVDEAAFDTEFCGRGFKDKLCVLQVSVDATETDTVSQHHLSRNGWRTHTSVRVNFVIDAMAPGIDLSPLRAALEDPAKTSVFHAAHNDVRLLASTLGIRVAGLWDTCVGERTLGCWGNRDVGLVDLVRKRCGVTVDKAMQSSDWAARPLTDAQVVYAAVDVQYLTDIMHAQRAELGSAGVDAVREACARIERVSTQPAWTNPGDVHRLRHARRGHAPMSPAANRAASALLVEREHVAENRDVSVGAVMSNRDIVRVAVARPASVEALAAVPGVSPRAVRVFGALAVDALRRAGTLGAGEGRGKRHARGGKRAVVDADGKGRPYTGGRTPGRSLSGKRRSNKKGPA